MYEKFFCFTSYDNLFWSKICDAKKMSFAKKIVNKKVFDKKKQFIGIVWALGGLFIPIRFFVVTKKNLVHI